MGNLMATQVKSRRQKLTTALKRLKSGVSVDGNTLDIAGIAARTYADAQAFARSVADKQARTLQRLGRPRRFKG